jgi:hypothetical protein
MTAGVNQDVCVSGTGSVMSWKEQFYLNDAIVVSRLNSSEPSIVEIAGIVWITVTVANGSTVDTLENF